MSSIIGLVLIIVGFFFLAAGQEKHHRNLTNRALKKINRLYLRTFGFLCVSCAIIYACFRYGFDIGLVWSFAWGCVAGWSVALCFSSSDGSHN